MEHIARNYENATTTFELLDKNNPVFSSFMYWASLLVLKFMLMSTLTAFQRIRTKVQCQLLAFFFIELDRKKNSSKLIFGKIWRRPLLAKL